MGKLASLYGGKDPRELPMYGIGEAAVYLACPGRRSRHGYAGSGSEGGRACMASSSLTARPGF